ncbi:MAG: polysaccharide biosynthesis/export family protein [Bacteroidetes bacterium]|nr:polysaccharide biosynthesis/export family protein [Bacteroidota bacterium]
MQNKGNYFYFINHFLLRLYFSEEHDLFSRCYSKLQQDASSKLRIYPNDILGINIFTINAEAYPYLSTGIDKAVSDNRSAYEKGFVVNENGELKLPLIGTVNLTGLTIAEAVTLLETKFKEFIDEPIVTIKKLNFKVTILGEVNKPGTYPISNESYNSRSTGLGGDLSTYGDRKKRTHHPN